MALCALLMTGSAAAGAGHCEIKVYADPGLSGPSATFWASASDLDELAYAPTGTEPTLSGISQKISSIEIVSGEWQICMMPRFIQCGGFLEPGQAFPNFTKEEWRYPIGSIQLITCNAATKAQPGKAPDGGKCAAPGTNALPLKDAGILQKLKSGECEP
jgi:hypothetical protein